MQIDLNADLGEGAGSDEALLALVSSTIALGIVIPLFLWVDRLESEPPRLLWFSFLWGALISPLGALVLACRAPVRAWTAG